LIIPGTGDVMTIHGAALLLGKRAGVARSEDAPDWGYASAVGWTCVGHPRRENHCIVSPCSPGGRL